MKSIKNTSETAIFPMAMPSIASIISRIMGLILSAVAVANVMDGIRASINLI